MKTDESIQALYAEEVRQVVAERAILQRQMNELAKRLQVADEKLEWLRAKAGPKSEKQGANGSLFTLLPPEPTFRDRICGAIAENGSTPSDVREVLRKMAPKVAERASSDRIYKELNKLKNQKRIENRNGRWFLVRH